VWDAARTLPTISEYAMQSTSLTPHQVEVSYESLPTSISLRSQNLTILHKAGKVVVVSLEATD
jgi:hypothetical protein